MHSQTIDVLLQVRHIFLGDMISISLEQVASSAMHSRYNFRFRNSLLIKNLLHSVDISIYKPYIEMGSGIFMVSMENVRFVSLAPFPNWSNPSIFWVHMDTSHGSQARPQWTLPDLDVQGEMVGRRHPKVVIVECFLMWKFCTLR